MTTEEIKAINNRIAELEKAKNELEEEKKEFEKNLNEHFKAKKEPISAELKVLKNKVRWYNYANKHYEYKDYSTSLAVQLFGKRAKDLTPEEKKEYNRLMAQKTRNKMRKQVDK